ncbi:MAG: hypothetical protein CL607_27470 [Anaerolineaceae bacterium]|nr:hypothetical protein [Anaerolineaceae bacterium]
MLNPTLPLQDDHDMPASIAIKGDFAQLYEQYKQQVYRYMLARTGSVPDAHDLTAQTFLGAYRSWPQFRQDVPVIHWLMSIARRKAADHFRQQRDEVQLTETLNLPDPAPLPEDMAAQEIRLQKVSEMLHALSEDRQEALALRLFAGLSNVEVAHIMGKTPEAVAMLVLRATRDLQERLGVDHDDPTR